jgi:hypothetical protein
VPAYRKQEGGGVGSSLRHLRTVTYAARQESLDKIGNLWPLAQNDVVRGTSRGDAFSWAGKQPSIRELNENVALHAAGSPDLLQAVP